MYVSEGVMQACICMREQLFEARACIFARACTSVRCALACASACAMVRPGICMYRCPFMVYGAFFAWVCACMHECDLAVILDAQVCYMHMNNMHLR